jgi:hypothetical protein
MPFLGERHRYSSGEDGDNVSYGGDHIDGGKGIDTCFGEADTDTIVNCENIYDD